MANAPPAPPLRGLALHLLGTLLLAVGLYLLLIVFPGRFLPHLSATEVLLLEAGGVLLVAYLVARALTGAATAVILRRGEFARGHAVRLFLNLVIGVAAVLALSKLAGVSAESILLGSAFAGIVLGLAAQTVLANVFAGLLLVVADPFRPGDRVGFVSSTYGVFASSYAHELGYPTYTGTILDIGLIYTVVELDGAGVAKIPNNVVMSSLVILPRGAEVRRVRMTFPLSVPIATVESALAEIAPSLPAPPSGRAAPHLEVADVGAATWDGVVVLWSEASEAAAASDRIRRTIVARLGASPAPPSRPAP
ncbi:MAG: mechanosensitive ion channel family protein [Thermoplasmata archaeon]